MIGARRVFEARTANPIRDRPSVSLGMSLASECPRRIESGCRGAITKREGVCRAVDGLGALNPTPTRSAARRSLLWEAGYAEANHQMACTGTRSQGQEDSCALSQGRSRWRGGRIAASEPVEPRLNVELLTCEEKIFVTSHGRGWSQGCRAGEICDFQQWKSSDATTRGADTTTLIHHPSRSA